MFSIIVLFWTLEFSVSLIGLLLHCTALYGLLQVISSKQALILTKMTVLGMAAIVIEASTDVVRVISYLDGSHVENGYLDIYLRQVSQFLKG